MSPPDEVYVNEPPASDAARLDAMHEALRRYFAGNLGPVPLDDLRPSKILELGCGSGAWPEKTKSTAEDLISSLQGDTSCNAISRRANLGGRPISTAGSDPPCKRELPSSRPDKGARIRGWNV